MSAGGTLDTSNPTLQKMNTQFPTTDGESDSSRDDLKLVLLESIVDALLILGIIASANAPLVM